MTEKMYAILNSGEKKEINTSAIFENQYDTIDGKRIFDTDIIKIENDIRLGEFYTGNCVNGTYDEVMQSITETREKIEKCFDCKTGESCFWWQNNGFDQIERKHEMQEDGSKIETDIKHWHYHCEHKEKYEGCIYDIEDKPVLFREKNKCFFCKFPNGIPDNEKFIDFIIKNSAKYDIFRKYENGPYIFNPYVHKPFGSYRFEFRKVEEPNYRTWFEISNNNYHFLFLYDFVNNIFVYRTFSDYFYSYGKFIKAKHGAHRGVIACWDKFEKWFLEMVEDYRKEVK